MVEASLVHLAAIERERDVPAVGRALELRLPGAIRRAPGQAVLATEARDPGSNWQIHRVYPFGPEFLRGQAEQAVRDVLAAVRHAALRSVSGKPARMAVTR